jgi:acetylornithine deacetylase
MQEYIDLLKNLISTPSFSREEDGAAQIMRHFLDVKKIPYREKFNNTWALNQYFDATKPTILLNSHIDTVKPAKGWTYDPFFPTQQGNRITGLGSNDAGGPLVALLATFVHFYNRSDLSFNLVFAASSEEETSGANGFELIKTELPEISFAVVGEPTHMQVAIAEKGLLVLDGIAYGKSGHAARNEGENAIYKALDDIQTLRNYSFEKISDVLGAVKITVTQIEAGSQHNVVPDVCKFVVDVRTNELYSNQQAFETLSRLIASELKPRSFRLNSSGISKSHPFAVKAHESGILCYGSPTTSDQAIMPWPSVKMGPGDSARSHTADEYILIPEIEDGIRIYIHMLDGLNLRP